MQVDIIVECGARRASGVTAPGGAVRLGAPAAESRAPAVAMSAWYLAFVSSFQVLPPLHGLRTALGRGAASDERDDGAEVSREASAPADDGARGGRGRPGIRAEGARPRGRVRESRRPARAHGRGAQRDVDHEHLPDGVQGTRDSRLARPRVPLRRSHDDEGHVPGASARDQVRSLAAAPSPSKVDRSIPSLATTHDGRVVTARHDRVVTHGRQSFVSFPKKIVVSSHRPFDSPSPLLSRLLPAKGLRTSLSRTFRAPRNSAGSRRTWRRTPRTRRRRRR